MKYITTIGSRWCILILAFIVAISGISRAASCSPGDEITLTRDEPLLFREQVFRQGRKGEKFTVLPHRPDTQKIFVSAKDKAGKQIALSVPEEAVALVPVEVETLRANAVAAAKAGTFPDALRLIDRAIQSVPTDAALFEAKNAIMQLQAAKTSLIQAQTEKARLTAEAAQKRKNAEVIERANLQSPRYASNFDRSQPAQLRVQADLLEEKLKQTRQAAAVSLMDVESAKVRLRAAAEISITAKPTSQHAINDVAKPAPSTTLAPAPANISGASNGSPDAKNKSRVAEHLVQDSQGLWSPADGYLWANPQDPKDTSVVPKHLVKDSNGLWNPATGYQRANPNDEKDKSVVKLSPATDRISSMDASPEPMPSKFFKKLDEWGNATQSFIDSHPYIKDAAAQFGADWISQFLGGGSGPGSTPLKQVGPGGNRLQPSDPATGRFLSPGTTIYGQGFYRP
ncbi:MAG: hypothetical protein WCK55_03260 [Verrucomicrobiota bacterium]